MLLCIGMEEFVGDMSSFEYFLALPIGSKSDIIPLQGHISPYPHAHSFFREGQGRVAENRIER